MPAPKDGAFGAAIFLRDPRAGPGRGTILMAGPCEIAPGRVRNSEAAKRRRLRRTLMMVAQDQAQQTRIPSKNWLSIAGGTRIDLPGRSQPASQLGLFHQHTPARPPISVSQIGVVDYGCCSLERFYPKVSAPSAFSAITPRADRINTDIRPVGSFIPSVANRPGPCDRCGLARAALRRVACKAVS